MKKVSREKRNETYAIYALLDDALAAAGITKKEIMWDYTFAIALENLGVPLPMKINLRTGRLVFAFGKNDKNMRALLEHPDPQVRALVAARVVLRPKGMYDDDEDELK